MSEKKRICQLETPFEKDESPWSEYPRPQFRRSSYLPLCGSWELSVLKDNNETHLGEITVPYPPESRISGINRMLSPLEKYIYKKRFTLPENFIKSRVLLHFGAVDQLSRVWLNGEFLGENAGGYLPFSFDITDMLSDGENQLTVEVTDALDEELPYGKQRYKRGGMWYTPISGIWQTVWLESVPENYIGSVKLTPALDGITIDVNGGREEKRIAIQTEKGEIVREWTGNSVTIPIENPINWTPENPHLYSFTLTDGNDEIQSYFALRTITIETVNGQAYICLNGKPYFFHGLLDQGYFSDGIYTPASSQGYLWDIKTMKKLGFNMLRKHIKIEPDLFYYYCDKYGMIVFQDMVNSGKYNFFIDTALPTAGIKRGIKHPATPKRRMYFEQSARLTAEQLYNHPCVCCYTIFNEGWGQYDADRIYRELKQLDPSRVWDATSGWFSEKESDVQSEHVYFRKIKLKADPGRPLVLSEFGGYSCKIENHSFNLDDNYGYKLFSTAEELTAGLYQLYKNEIIPAIEQGLCAAVLTQVSDVEDETNGLVTYDRQLVKVDEKTMKEISAQLFAAFYNNSGI